jgi:hypothetical protein
MKPWRTTSLQGGEEREKQLATSNQPLVADGHTSKNL